MEVICIKTKIKKELLGEVRTWFQTLKERMNETLESLENEGVFVESVFLDMQGADLYIIYYMKAENISRVYDVFSNSKLAIDSYHKECWKKYCEGRVVLEELLDIDRLDCVKSQ
jgi:dihydroorotase